ncbi:MAG: hypothetical protein MUO67_10225, partial [Anaerolineales bacterium]|nr:hypothetical protein [Anaerolineales bacterium]
NYVPLPNFSKVKLIGQIKHFSSSALQSKCDGALKSPAKKTGIFLLNNFKDDVGNYPPMWELANITILDNFLISNEYRSPLLILMSRPHPHTVGEWVLLVFDSSHNSIENEPNSRHSKRKSLLKI